MSNYPSVPHLAWPLRLQGAGLAAVEQDTLDDVTQCVQIVLSTPVGSREDIPEFGLPDQTFSQGGADPEEIEDAVSEWEERAEVEIDTTLDESLLAQGQDRLPIRVRLREEG